jgi:hypothetical protein
MKCAEKQGNQRNTDSRNKYGNHPGCIKREAVGSFIFHADKDIFRSKDGYFTMEKFALKFKFIPYSFNRFDEPVV